MLVCMGSLSELLLNDDASKRGEDASRELGRNEETELILFAIFEYLILISPI